MPYAYPCGPCRNEKARYPGLCWDAAARPAASWSGSASVIQDIRPSRGKSGGKALPGLASLGAEPRGIVHAPFRAAIAFGLEAAFPALLLPFDIALVEVH